MRTKSARIAVLLLALQLIVSCSLVDPIVVRRIAECDPTTPTADGADCAAKLRSGYLDAVSDREMLNTATNAGLLALVTTFGIMASLGAVNADTILAGGIGGAALLAAPRIFGTDQRDFTYLAGAEAMSCVLDAARPALLLVSDKEFLADLQNKRQAVLDSIGELEQINAGLPSEAVTAVGQNLKTTLAEAKAIYLKSGRLLRTLKATDTRVLNAARSIDTTVNTALAQQRTDPLTFARSLGASTTLVQGQISQFLPQLPALSGKALEETSAGEIVSAVARAQQRIFDLQAATEEMEQVTSPFESASLRKRCTIDALEIRPFSAEPTRLTLPASDGSTIRSASIVVQGGKASHTAALIGNRPADPSTLVISMEETRDGFARVGVTATPGLTGGAYSLRIADQEGRSLTVPIVIGGLPPSPRPTVPKKALAPEQTRLAEVENLQKKLKALANCTAKPSATALESIRASLDPGAIDGRLGGDQSNTRRAIDNLLTLTLEGELSPPPTWTAMTGDVKAKANDVAKRVDAVHAALCEP